MIDEELTGRVIGVFYKIYNALGYGFIESIYHNSMIIELVSEGLAIETEKPIAVYYGSNVVGTFEADLVVQEKLILELKAKESLHPAHEAQLTNYLRATDIELGLLLNFGREPEFKVQIFFERKETPSGALGRRQNSEKLVSKRSAQIRLIRPIRVQKMLTKTATEDIQNYLTDASNMPGGYAEKLFVPENADEIADILREANEKAISVTVSGARTGTVGGAVPFGGYVISLERMNKIKSIDREKMTAVVEPGVILGDFQKAVDAEGLFYPPDPTEWSCQIGGTVATNASGARSFKYGATRGFVRRLKVVLASGDKLEISRGEAISSDGESIELPGLKVSVKIPTYERPDVRKNVSGFYNARPLDAIDLFIGSEGTLGVITEIELSLLPKPEGLFSGIVFFEKETELLAFVEDVRAISFDRWRQKSVPGAVATGALNASPSSDLILTKTSPVATAPGSDLDATLLEYFDGQALKFISEKFPETPTGMAGAIFFEQETTASNEDEIFEHWNALLEKYNADLDRSWFTTSDQDREKMCEFRHVLPVSVNEFIAKHKQKKVGTDMAVPDNKFPGFLKFYKDTLDASGIDYVIFGHIGDCHLHANLLPKNEDEAEHARHIYGRCIAQAVMLGGCVSAEHGIGKLKAKYLNVMMGERYMNEMIELKRAFDPNGILGRGNMFSV